MTVGRSWNAMAENDNRRKEEKAKWEKKIAFTICGKQTVSHYFNSDPFLQLLRGYVNCKHKMSYLTICPYIILFPWPKEPTKNNSDK